ncbi:uncharacterized protein LOC133897203 [Phragmites australis]|uniref:uncharacterized protein LOC133897203 n=1 Tax=Phragmites australis TaxID=29695 RepID=UPI002D7713B1|nr:uncharacterized protein LOC133897203 [Phragmites australis]
MLRVATAPPAPSAADDAAAAADAEEEEGEKEACLRSLPRPESGRGPATVSSHSWSRSPMHRCTYVTCAFNVKRVFCLMLRETLFLCFFGSCFDVICSWVSEGLLCP